MFNNLEILIMASNGSHDVYLLVIFFKKASSYTQTAPEKRQYALLPSSVFLVFLSQRYETNRVFPNFSSCFFRLFVIPL